MLISRIVISVLHQLCFNYLVSYPAAYLEWYPSMVVSSCMTHEQENILFERADPWDSYFDLNVASIRDVYPSNAFYWN